MANKSKSVTIQLTDKQRSALRGLTGEDHREVKFEAVTAATISAGRSMSINAGKKVLHSGRAMNINAGKKVLSAGKKILGAGRSI